MAASLQNIVVDSEHKLLALLDKLSVLEHPTKPIDPPSLYFDIEGRNLGRHGTMSILSLFIHPGNTTYLIDVHTLQGNTFDTANGKGTTLKGVLESPTVPKAFFDIRNDSDALFSLFGIKVAGIHDIQLMELARRQGSRRRLVGLARCIEGDLTAVSDQAAAAMAISAKKDGERLWNPRFGGTYDFFDQRPMPQKIVEYCSADVAILPRLWKAYIRDLGRASELFWRSQIWKKTLQRIKESQRPSYNPNGGDNLRSLGPWDWQSGEVDELQDAWNDTLLEEIGDGNTCKETAFGDYKFV